MRRLFIVGVWFIVAGPATAAPQLPVDLVGDWYTGNVSSIQYVDARTGRPKPAVGIGGGYQLHADGTYVDIVMVNSAVGADFVYAEGRATASANRVTLTQQKRTVMHKDPYATQWSSRPGPVSTSTYSWRIKSERDGEQTQLFLCLKDLGAKDEGEVCYRKAAAP